MAMDEERCSKAKIFIKLDICDSSGKGVSQRRHFQRTRKGTARGGASSNSAVFYENTKLRRKEGGESKGAFARYLYTIVRLPRLA
jgi:hypothetical protein